MGIGSWILDLSNIATHRTAVGREASWDRVAAVVSLLKARGDQDVSGVADRSLFYRLDEHGQSALRSWQQNGRAIIVPWADAEICQRLSDESDLHVVSNDNFRGLRRDFPVLQGLDRVWTFQFEPQLGLIRRPLAPLGEADISRAEEDEDRTPKRLGTPEGKRLLAREWRCMNPECPWSAHPAIEVLPVNDRGRAVCPDCDATLADAGPAEATRAVKIVVDGNVVERIPIAAGITLTLGRGSGPDRIDVRDLLPAEESERVSRRHLAVRNLNGRVLVEDLESSNGSVIRRSDGTEFRLEAGRRQILEEGDRACVTRRLHVAPSGLRYPRGIYTAEQPSSVVAGVTRRAIPPDSRG
jgi:hypothetical protein